MTAYDLRYLKRQLLAQRYPSPAVHEFVKALPDETDAPGYLSIARTLLALTKEVGA